MQTALHFWDGDSEISTKEHTLDMSNVNFILIIFYPLGHSVQPGPFTSLDGL